MDQTSTVPALTPEVLPTLAELETVIDAGIKVIGDTTRELALALFSIHSGKLYRKTHKSFEAYCLERWGISRTTANRIVTQGKVILTLESNTTESEEPTSLTFGKPAAKHVPPRYKNEKPVTQREALKLTRKTPEPPKPAAPSEPKTTFSHQPTANLDAYKPAFDFEARCREQRAEIADLKRQLEEVKARCTERYSTLKAHVKALEAENEQLRTRVEVGF